MGGGVLASENGRPLLARDVCADEPHHGECVDGGELKLDEDFVADCLQHHALNSAKNSPDLCALEPKAFVKQVIEGGRAVDDGDWVQPLLRQKDGAWQLYKFEVLYRLSDARGVPFPAFVNFVHAA